MLRGVAENAERGTFVVALPASTDKDGVVTYPTTAAELVGSEVMAPVQATDPDDGQVRVLREGRA